MAAPATLVTVCILSGSARSTGTIGAMQADDKPLILIVDDDAALREVLRDFFDARGYATQQLPDTRMLERRLHEAQPAIVILDRMMPGEDGVTACRRLRAGGHDVPVILLTAIDEPIDRVIGLESGADDYVGKPFDPRELEARIATILRRPRRVLRPENCLRFGAFEFDVALRLLVRDGVPVALAPREAALLAALARCAGRGLTRDELLERAGTDKEQFDRAVDAAIYRLRRIIEVDPARPQFIRTVRGVGYFLETAPADTGAP